MERAVIEVLVHFANGDLTELELVSQLARFGEGVVDLLPPANPSSHPMRDLRARVVELLEAIDRGEAVEIR